MLYRVAQLYMDVILKEEKKQIDFPGDDDDADFY